MCITKPAHLIYINSSSSYVVPRSQALPPTTSLRKRNMITCCAPLTFYRCILFFPVASFSISIVRVVYSS